MATLRALRPLAARSSLPISSRASLVSTLRFNSTIPTAPTPPPSRDPSHPHLYYHHVSDKIALSFLPTPPTTQTAIGILPATPDAGLEDFQENPVFREVLHRGIKDGLEKGVDERLSYEALMRPGDGYMTLTDERAVPPQGRIGETEDLIASVFVQDGKIVASSYEPLPSYRLVTGNGVCTLPPGLDKHVIEFLEQIEAKSDE